VKRHQPLFLIVVLTSGLLGGSTLLSLTGCQSGTTGLLRPIDPTAYQTVTNTIVIASQTAGSALPAPWGTAAEVAGASILALLAAWQGISHGQIKTLAANNPGPNNKPTP
jgi:hypothetical protein